MSKLESIIVSAAEMSQIEEQIFKAGMPVAALMEKAALLCTAKITTLYPLPQTSSVGILVGPGHNGGDALVIARELYLAGYQVKVYRPLSKAKDLTSKQANYTASLGIEFYEEIDSLLPCDLIVDGLFGFGLTRSLPENIVVALNKLDEQSQPVVSIDLPSGIHTDTGEVLGGSIRATHTLCLGLWKKAFFQDDALEYIGQPHRIDFGILPHHVWSVLPQPAPVRQMIPDMVRQFLPLSRSLVTYKYKQGHLLLICGSRRYSGGAILTALGARASGVGMLSVAVPETLKPLLVSQVPEALVIGCPETRDGAIASIPVNLDNFDVVACGPGLTTNAEAIFQQVLQVESPLILDADGLNLLAQLETIPTLAQRPAVTILTPHVGEFKRLFPEIELKRDRLSAVRSAAQQSQAIVVLKGARTAIATPEGSIWLNSDSTPALARGGTGDVLTGLIGGLMAQTAKDKRALAKDTVAAAACWHANAGIMAAKERTELGVDAFTLTDYLVPAAKAARDLD
ncbi:NAD(P)H-hydrate dehydratase [Myxosarcina sp. GI1(2024)]